MLIEAKAEGIKLLILDVDGVLTTGVIYYLSQGVDMRGFHIQDGLGIQLLQKTGVTVAVISGKKSDAVARRLDELGIQHAYLGHEDKIPAFEELKSQLGLENDQIAYMGDDLPDLPLLRRAGLAITVPQAPEIIQQHADLITKNKGGKGAVREACEFIMKSKNQYQAVIQSYLTK